MPKIPGKQLSSILGDRITNIMCLSYILQCSVSCQNVVSKSQDMLHSRFKTFGAVHRRVAATEHDGCSAISLSPIHPYALLMFVLSGWDCLSFALCPVHHPFAS